VRQIDSNTSDTLTVTREWETVPDATSQYQLVNRDAYRTFFSQGEEQVGVATGGGPFTLTDTTKDWQPDELVGRYVRIVEGTGSFLMNQFGLRITANSSHTLTIDGEWNWWEGPPDSTSRYVIVEHTRFDFPRKVHGNGGSEAPSFRCVREILMDTQLMNWNSECQTQLNGIRTTLEEALGLPEGSPPIRLPVLFTKMLVGEQDKATAYIPHAVNLQAINGKLLLPEPYGPRDDTDGDLFKAAAVSALTNGGIAQERVQFIDDWDWYHVAGGEVHCGTNVQRGMPEGNWW